MGFRMGIVGLPNVGKSTLFNALTRTAAAQAANFPFCTIEPNVGEVAVPDARLDRLAAIAQSKQIVPTRMTFVDIAGLVKGASRGEGLGNQFLANIREVDAIAHVLRCFEDGDVAHVDGRVDPVADADAVETELMLADLDSIEKRRAGLLRKLKGGDKEAAQADRLLALAQTALEDGKPARTVAIDADDLKAWRMLQLLTSKPVLYVCNVDEANAAAGNAHSQAVAQMAADQGAASVVISAQIEEEISQLDADEAAMFLSEMGLEEAGLDRLIRAGYDLLHLETYFTVGPKEARAWTVPPAPPRPRPPASSTAISSAASSGPRPSPMTISSLSAASRRQRMPARCGPRARGTSSRMATCCISSSTPDGPRPAGTARPCIHLAPNTPAGGTSNGNARSGCGRAGQPHRPVSIPDLGRYTRRPLVGPAARCYFTIIRWGARSRG